MAILIRYRRLPRYLTYAAGLAASTRRRHRCCYASATRA